MKYYVVDDNTGYCDKQVDFETFKYYVEQFGEARVSKHGDTYWPDATTHRNLPARETVLAYNPQGWLIAEKV